MSSGDVTTQRIEAEPWFADGLRFECTQCGNCCTGPPGYVWFTEDEGRAMARELKMEIAAFQSKYARRAMKRWTLKETRTEHGYDCVFLDRSSHPGTAVCGIYKARPHQCRTWPFWPEIVKSERSWNVTRRDTPCPGIGTGALVSAEQIRIIRDSSSEK